MTAVEWLVKMLYSPVGKGFIEGRRQIPHGIIEQAKAMEKEQIFDAWNNALINTHIASNSIGVPYDKEKYYNETYNKSSV
jgi:hypothetical protein